MDDESVSKDRFFGQIGAVADEMIAAHGRDFAVGVLLLAARYIAQPPNAEARGATSTTPIEKVPAV